MLDWFVDPEREGVASWVLESLRTVVQRDRVEAGLAMLRRIGLLPLAPKHRLHYVLAGAFAKALWGCEVAYMSQKAIQSLRTAVVRALYKEKGAS